LASASRPAKPVHKSNAFKIPHLASGVPGLSSPGARLHRARTLQVKLHPGVCTHASPYRLRPSWSPMWLPPAWSRHSPWWACEHPVTHSVRLCAYKKQLVLGKAAMGEASSQSCQPVKPASRSQASASKRIDLAGRLRCPQRLCHGPGSRASISVNLHGPMSRAFSNGKSDLLDMHVKSCVFATPCRMHPC